MQKITTQQDLKMAIQKLENKQAEELVLLKGQFHAAYESLRPVNIIKHAFKEMIAEPGLKTTIANTAIGVITGFIAKKIFIGNSNNPFTKLIGLVLEITVASAVTKNPDGIKSVGGNLLKRIIHPACNPGKT